MGDEARDHAPDGRPEGAAGTDDESREGFVTIRDALVGLVFLWIAILVAVTTVQLVVAPLFEPALTAVVAVVGAGIAALAGYGSLRRLGFR